MKVLDAFNIEGLKDKKLMNIITPLEPTPRNKQIIQNWTQFWRKKKVPYIVFEKENGTNHGTYPVYWTVYKEQYVTDSWPPWRATTTLEKLMGI